MKKLQFVGIAVIMAESALAGNITWNGGAGDTDLSKPANWGVSTLSGADNATINANNQTFTLEKNTSFNTMTLGTDAKTATFDFSANPTNEVYLGAMSGEAFAPKASGMVFTFKGGVWRGTGTGSAIFNTMVGGNDSTMVLDGTIVTNFATLAFGYKSPSQQLTELKNGAQVHVTKAENGNGGGSNTVLKVSSGSKLIASGGVRVANGVGGAAEGKGFHKLIVEGEGSLLKTGTGQAQSGLRIGDTYMGCSVIVTNRATLYAKGLYFSSHHNNLWMSNATVSLLGGYLNLDGVSNRLDLLDCDVSIDRLFVCGSYGRCRIRGNRGTIALPTFVNPGGISWGTENEVEIWDTATAINYGGYGSPVGRGNVYRLMRSAVVNTGAAGVLYVTASQREQNICGEGATGGVVRCNAAITFASAQTNCYLRLMDGVRCENLTTDFYFGYRPKSQGVNEKGVDSTIYIGTNSTMSLLKLYVGNTGHRVVIDSGTLETPEIKLNADNRVGGTQTNSVIFAGTHPKFLYTPSAAYSLPTTGGWYVFEVPSEGYEAAPLQVSKGLKIPDGAQVVVHADVEKLSRHFNGKGGLVPLMTGTSVTVSADKLAAMTQALGQPGARFVVKDNVLYLRVPAKGLMLLLR